MTWSYTASPGRSNATQRRDAVRVLINDTVESEKLLDDEYIAFYLSEAVDDVYKAAALCCHSLAARFASMADAEVDGIKQSYWKTREAYMRLASRYETYSTRFGGGVGVPLAGGISLAEMEAERDNPDRVQPFFQIRQFDNPSFDSDPVDTVK